MQIGYVRVSTQDQDLRLQYEALRQAQCDKVYEDKVSGTMALTALWTDYTEVWSSHQSVNVSNTCSCLRKRYEHRWKLG